MSRLLVFGSGGMPWEEQARGEVFCWRSWQLAQAAKERGHHVSLVLLRRHKESGWRHQLVTRTRQDGINVYWVLDHLCHERPEVVQRIVSGERPHCVLGVGAFPCSVAVNFAGELPLWTDFDGDPLAEAQLRFPADVDAAIVDAHAHLTPVLARADRLSSCSERQQMALIGQLLVLGRLNEARAEYPFVSSMPHAIGSAEIDAIHAVPRVLRSPTDAMVLLASGGYGGSTDWATLISVLERVLEKVPTVRFVSLGGTRPGYDPAPFEAFRRRLSESRFRHRCEFHAQPFVSEYPAYYASSNAAIMLDRRTPEALLGSRPQLVEWLAAGIPAVCTRVSEVAEDLAARGLVLGAADGSAAVESIAKLASDPDFAEAMAARGRAHIEEQFASDTVFEPFLAWVDHPTRAPEPGREVVLRRLDHPVERVRQKLALVRHEVRGGGAGQVLKKAAEFLARRARAKAGSVLARRGVELAIPTVDTSSVDAAGLGFGCPRRSATYWKGRALSYALPPDVCVVLIASADSEPEMLSRCVEHLGRQYYRHFQLSIVLPKECPAPLAERARAAVVDFDARDLLARVLEGEHPLGQNAFASSDYLCVLGPETWLRSDALAELVEMAVSHEADVVYADEVQVDASSGAARPVHRPQWSPDFLLSYPYIGQPALYRAELVESWQELPELGTEALEYHLPLQVTERTDRVEHVPETLSCRQIPRGRTLEARVHSQQQLNLVLEKCLVRSVWRRGQGAVVERGNRPGSFRVRHAIRGEPKVSILVSTRDRVDLLKPCIESIEKRTTYRNREVVIIDNGSRDPATLDFMKRWGGRVLRYDEPFNFSRLHNKAVWEVNGEQVVLLNNDTEVITPDWIEAMLEHAQRPEVGAVGAKLIRQDGSLQHAGIVLTEKGFVYSQDWCREQKHDAFADVVRNYLAVTAACMMLRRELYLAVNGLDERFAVAYNDVDLCLRLRKLGLRNVYTPHAVLYHHESASRGYGVQPTEDDQLLARRWLGTLGSDPYLGALGTATGSRSTQRRTTAASK